MIEYNSFIADLESNNLGHWARILERTRCKIIVKLLNTDLGIDTEYNKWCKANCNNKYFVYNETYAFFETEEDAVAFILRWI